MHAQLVSLPANAICMVASPGSLAATLQMATCPAACYLRVTYPHLQQQAHLSKLSSGTQNCFPGSLAYQPPMGPSTGQRAVLGGDWKWTEGIDFLFQRPSAAVAASWLLPLWHWQQQRLEAPAIPCSTPQPLGCASLGNPGSHQVPVSEVRAQTRIRQMPSPGLLITSSL